MIQDPIILSMHFIKLLKGFLWTPQEGILNYANRNLIAFTEFGDRPLLVVYDLEQAWIQSLMYNGPVIGQLLPILCFHW